MPIRKIPVDRDTRRGKAALQIRNKAAGLSIGLIVLGWLVALGGSIGLAPSLFVFLLKTGLSIFTILTILIGFEIIAFDTGSTITAEATPRVASEFVPDDEDDE